MKIGWFDGRAGASGDMILGALVGAGTPLEILQSSVEPLGLGIGFRADQVRRGSLVATKVHVDVPHNRMVRHLPELLEMLAALPPAIAQRAGAVFHRLASAEAAVHGIPPEEVHFHEVGGLDCIADVVATIAGIHYLDLTEIHCLGLSLGQGWSQTCHGQLPAPVPAVLEILKGLAPVQAGTSRFEATTPTGAALMAVLVDRWGPLPPMTIGAVGIGAGTRDTEEPNTLRLVVGDPSTAGLQPAEALQIEANVDDLDPRLWPTALAAIMAAGAYDAWSTPITMKKGRPAFTIAALCHPAQAAAVRTAIFRETSTIGLREFPVVKHGLERSESEVRVDGMAIRVKVAGLAGEVLNRSVEWEDVVVAAAALGKSAKEILSAATSAAATSPGTAKR
jgi:uncharacterized protein (TIGR00299 family) protein